MCLFENCDVVASLCEREGGGKATESAAYDYNIQAQRCPLPVIESYFLYKTSAKRRQENRSTCVCDSRGVC